ncbi:DtxR family transcriptional regulator, Mn-dependent transcriptional regulator [Catalinimonas alkaloidigena]|uniref:Transcriptional regulator MntR n=2 Tax=Catalinimonas alkaloidigena TaxID=1075417 RepID=A0A1G9T322_9BACT|nr:DtxR family transcriptional regulator, Mn-dependent transcriptional regulator [Catalinimonas alkaloidigena]
MFTYTEENYLKAIYHLTEGDTASVSTNAIAEAVDTRPASVTDMLRKLAAKDLIHYIKYQGVSLTDSGQAIALQVIRKHRLWETFLVEKLKFQWDQVHEVAEQLEHIQSPLLIERLDELLGYPQFDPHGDPIPDQRGRIQATPRLPLNEAPHHQPLTVEGVRETSPLFLQYLDKLAITIGARVQVLDRVEFDQSLEISIEARPSQIVSREVGENIYVSVDS